MPSDAPVVEQPELPFDEDGEFPVATGTYLDVEDGDLTNDMGREADEQAVENDAE